MIFILVQIIQFISQALSLIVIIDIFLSYFMDPFNPVRRTLDSVVQPMLNPIRRFVPLVGMLDLSPIVLLIMIQFISYILIQILIRL
jgi:YggT family protein